MKRLDEYKYQEKVDTLQELKSEKDKLKMLYQWVNPYVCKSINDNFDGVESFDLCPVDVSTLKTHKGGWKWCRNFEYDEIGKTIFYTEEECWEVYNKNTLTRIKRYTKNLGG